MHRNTYILVSILAVLAALVVGVNVGKKISPVSPPAPPTPTPLAKPNPTLLDTTLTQTYVDNACGFSLEYSNDYSLTENASGSAILSSTGSGNQSIVMTCQKNIPRPPLASDKIQSLMLPASTGASVSATLYHDQSSKDSSPIDAIIFTHPTRKLDVFVAGYGDSFNAAIKTIQVIQ